MTYMLLLNCALKLVEEIIKWKFSCFEKDICHNTVVTGVVTMNIRLCLLGIAGTQKIFREPCKTDWKPHGSISATPTHAVSSLQYTGLYPHKATIVPETAFCSKLYHRSARRKGAIHSGRQPITEK